MRLSCGLLLSCVLATACAASPRVAAAPKCAAGWQPEWSADSVVALCLPPGFHRAHDRPGTWRREREYLVRDVITVHVDPRAAWESGEIDARWPPTLATGPCVHADCVTTDSLVRHVDTVAGVAVHVETGLLSGGAAGLRRHPALAAGWETADGRRVHVTGLADRASTLDTLRAALRTLKVAAP